MCGKKKNAEPDPYNLQFNADVKVYEMSYAFLDILIKFYTYE